MAQYESLIRIMQYRVCYEKENLHLTKLILWPSNVCHFVATCFMTVSTMNLYQK